MGKGRTSKITRYINRHPHAYGISNKPMPTLEECNNALKIMTLMTQGNLKNYETIKGTYI